MSHKVEIDIDMIGRGTLLVDGQDISEQVVGMNLQSFQGQTAQLQLFTVPGQTVFVGEAEVVSIPAGIGAEVLEQIDVEALHAKAAKLPWGNSTELVANTVQVLKGMCSYGSGSQ